jgi:hypothetical protein
MEDLKSVSVQILVLKDINFLSKKKKVSILWWETDTCMREGRVAKRDDLWCLVGGFRSLAGFNVGLGQETGG